MATERVSVPPPFDWKPLAPVTTHAVRHHRERLAGVLPLQEDSRTDVATGLAAWPSLWKGPSERPSKGKDN